MLLQKFNLWTKVQFELLAQIELTVAQQKFNTTQKFNFMGQRQFSDKENHPDIRRSDIGMVLFVQVLGSGLETPHRLCHVVEVRAHALHVGD